MTRSVGVDLFDDSARHRGAARCKRSIGVAHMGGAAASSAFGDDLDLVGHRVLRSDLVGFGAWDLAMSGLIVDLLNAGDGDRQSAVAAGRS